MPEQRQKPLWGPIKRMDPRTWKPDQKKLEETLLGKDADRKNDGRRSGS